MEKQSRKLPETIKNNSQEQISAEDQEILDQVKKLPISEEEQNNIIATMEMYSGPIPHPKILAGYQALYPKAAEKIIENGLDESRHRRHLETSRQKRRGRLAWASMYLLVFVCLLFMGGSLWLISTGHTIIGTFFGGGSFITLAGSLMNNITQLSSNDDISQSKPRENENHN